MLPFEAVNLASLCLALLGMSCLAIWPLFRERAAMLVTQLVGITSLALHYASEGVATAAAANALGALQIIASLVFGRHPRLRWIGYVLVPVILGASLLTWRGMPSLLSAAGMAFVAVGRAQSNPISMRCLVLAGGPFWLAHDLIIASPVAVADALSLVAGVVSLWRSQSKRPSVRSRASIKAG